MTTGRRRTGSVTIGYTAGVFDLFHAGHLNLLEQARERCDHLIVAVTCDELAERLKGTRPLLPLLERMAVVGGMRQVDEVLPQTSWDKPLAWQTLRFDVLFAGDNVRHTDAWRRVEREMEPLGVRVEYLSATYSRRGELLERGLHDLVAD